MAEVVRNLLPHKTTYYRRIGVGFYYGVVRHGVDRNLFGFLFLALICMMYCGWDSFPTGHFRRRTGENAKLMYHCPTYVGLDIRNPGGFRVDGQAKSSSVRRPPRVNW